MQAMEASEDKHNHFLLVIIISDGPKCFMTKVDLGTYALCATQSWVFIFQEQLQDLYINPLCAARMSHASSLSVV